MYYIFFIIILKKKNKNFVVQCLFYAVFQIILLKKNIYILKLIGIHSYLYKEYIIPTWLHIKVNINCT